MAPNQANTESLVCPQCLEAVSVLVPSPEYSDEHVCPECAEHSANDSAYDAHLREEAYRDEELWNDGP